MSPTWMIAYDDTPSSRNALDEAARALCPQKGKLVLFHAVTWVGGGELDRGPLGVALEEENPVAKRAMRQIDESLEKVRAHLIATYPDLDVVTDWTPGEVVQSIVNAADRHQADLVVLGTEGLTGFQRLMLGSVAERVARDCSRDTLLVRGPADGEAPARHLPPKKVSVCLSLDEENDPADVAAVAAAVKLAAPSKASVELLHVLGPAYIPASGLGFTDEARRAVDDAAEQRSERAAQALELLGQPVVAAGLELSVEVVTSSRSVADAVVHALEREGVDLVVAAIHRRTGLARIFGSTAYRIARSSKAPVLLVRPLAGAEKA